MNIAVSTESTLDLPAELIEIYKINVLPYEVVLDGKTFLDGEVSTQEMFEYVEKTGVLPKTTAINEFRYREYFENLLNTHDAVIHISLSSGITSSTQNAINAANSLNNCYVVDSKSLSTGIALLAIYAAKLSETEDAKTVFEKVSARVPYVQASFIIERLDYLYKGGRCSALAYFGANLLKLKPQILVLNGKMQPAKKYRGSMENVVKSYCNDTLDRFNNPDLEEVFITYTTATEGMLENARKTLIDRGFKKIRETHAGGTITSHCGEHCLGILYINDGGVDG